MDFISEQKLRDLFNSEECLQVIKLESSRPNKRSAAAPKLSAEVESPFAAAIMESEESPRVRARLAKDLQLDAAAAQAQNDLSELDDPNFAHFNSSDIGIKLEYWVCINIPCPGCGKKLYKYANPSMPAVDVKCNNTHTPAMGPRFYQIKTTVANRIYKKYKYFSLENQYICVGSYRYGYNCHIMTPGSSSIDILVGYICIEYKEIQENKIKIEGGSSFILIPNLSSQSTDTYYYEYISIPPDEMTVIRFNSHIRDMFTVIKLSNHPPLKINLNAQIDLSFNYQTIEPLEPITLLKYLIMKKKYLELKKNMNL
jgi:hypothetical protein